MAPCSVGVPSCFSPFPLRVPQYPHRELVSIPRLVERSACDNRRTARARGAATAYSIASSRSPCVSVPPVYSLLCVRDDARFGTSVRADPPALPQGSRSGPGYADPIHHHLVGPIRPTCGHISTSQPSDLYEMPSLCLFA
jgi:hypothetical protein